MILESANAALFAAYALAQGEVENASKASVNPHFKSRYADLAEVLNTVRPVFARHGLAIIQSVSTSADSVSVTTTIAHKDGGFICSSLSHPVASGKVQELGSVTTYLRRYALSAMTGISQEDDDGNAASQRPVKVAAETPSPIDGKLIFDAKTHAANGTEALLGWFNELSKSHRQTVTSCSDWPNIKALAAKNSSKVSQ